VRLLIYIYSLENGGAERVFANLANHWAKKGWNITVVTVASVSTDFYVLDPAITRIALNLAGRRGDRNVLTGFWRAVTRVKALRRILQRVQPNIALSAINSANIILGLATHGMPEVQAIGSERNFPPMAPMGIIWETLRRYTYGQLSAVVAVTQECADWLRRHSNARRVPVIPNAACWPLAQQAPHFSPITHCSPHRKILLAVGRLSPEKNFTTLIEVFAQLAPRHPEWDLVILGDGPLRQALQSQVQTARLNQRIFLAGRVGNVGEWYERADLYALCSHFEGFPNTLAEAMAYGVPAVSFDCDTGPRDILRHDIDGLLVAPGDVAGLESALDKVMGDDRLRRHFASNAIQARERFSMEEIAGMWEELFHDCMTGRVGKTNHAMAEAKSKNYFS
jgi:glycosyltransferase involved in cell wall biosynthesis